MIRNYFAVGFFYGERDIAKAIEAGAGARSGLVYPHTSDAIKSLDKIQ